MITTTRGPMEEGRLRKTEGEIDNDVEHTTWVEYCLSDCPGAAHVTGQGDAPGVFCAQHIHRSVNMTLKQGLDVFGVAADLT